MQKFRQFKANPMGVLTDTFIQNQYAQMERQNPQKFRQIRQMLSGKSGDQLLEIANNIAADRGMNLSDVAAQYGVNM